MVRTVYDGPETRPPGAPDTRRRIRLYLHQWIGLPLLALVPALAMLGVLGTARQQAVVEGEHLQVRVDHPARLRVGQRADLRIEVRNRRGSAVDGIAVMVDHAYLEGFTEVRFTPGPAGTEHPALDSLAALDSGSVTVSIEADRPWLRQGQVRVAARETDTLTVEIRTLVLP
jgi:hypothetical protein